jgi:hypothetical protein
VLQVITSNTKTSQVDAAAVVPTNKEAMLNVAHTRAVGNSTAGMHPQ